jgi:hypothetical protein
VESELELIELVARACEELEIPYAIGGSMAAMAYSEYRVTSDIDVVLSLRAEDVPRFLGRFPKSEYYHDEKAALEAVASGGQFNILLVGEALKIDVHVASDPVAKAQITRARRLRSPLGVLANFSPPEELIVKKLEYHHVSGSERQLRDVATMLKVGGDDIDRAHVEELVKRHGLTNSWRAVLARLDRG